MTGFREFAQTRVDPTPDPHLVELLDLARLYIEEDFDFDFHNSCLQRVMSGWQLSPKQLALLEKMASGELAEGRRERRLGRRWP
jgi:hypothetical protein